MFIRKKKLLYVNQTSRYLFFHLPNILKPVFLNLYSLIKFKRIIVNIKHSGYNFFQLPSVLLKKKFKRLNINKTLTISSFLVAT